MTKVGSHWPHVARGDWVIRDRLYAEIVSLWRSGASIEAIAERTACGRDTVRRVLDEAGEPPPLGSDNPYREHERGRR
jgi:DNA invertase Pin-like site-specific DNA recombinase